MDLSSPPTSFFAPWNVAWDTWEGAPDFSSEHWTAHLCNLLEYHMCHGVIEPQAEPSSLDMFNGEPVIIAPTSSQRRSFTVNGDRILARIHASDGFVYVTRNLLFPTWTTTTLQDVLISNDLTTYVSLLETVALAEYILDPNISYTLLAPTNQAFEQLGDEYLEYLQFTADGLDDLWRILLYHCIPGEPYPSSLLVAKNEVLISWEGSPLYFNKKEEQEVICVGTDESTFADCETSSALIVNTNLLASNGIAHVLDSVLLISDLLRYPTIASLESDAPSSTPTEP